MNTSVAMTLTAQEWTLTPSNTPIPSLTPTQTTKPTAAPTRTPTLIPTHDPDRYYAPSREYSFIPPLGWVAVDPDDPLQEPPVRGPQIGDFTLNLQIYRDETAFGVFNYASSFEFYSMEQDTSIKEIQENALITDDGEAYIRWEITIIHDEVKYHQTFYFFGEEKSVLFIIYTREEKIASEMDPLVDKSMQTVIFHPILNGVEGIVL
jgi:hypothetical protein